MKKEFIVERNGRAFCLYAGLLDEAHSRGLHSIHTSLLQAPTELNDHTAIVSATVVITDPSSGSSRTFTGIGDASPDNVNPSMRNSLIRLAETRAKARALRDSINVGVTALEELADPDAESGEPVDRRPKARAACPHCKASDGRPGRHHHPDCPFHTQNAAGRRS